MFKCKSGLDQYKLQYEMKTKNVSVDQMCETCGISRSAFYRKCKGTSQFNLNEIQAIVNVLGVDPISIFFVNEVS